MWANYDYSAFPLVYVKFNQYIKDEEDFNNFLKRWTFLYHDKKDFTFVFDTVKVSAPSISYCFKMRKFIKKLKQFPHQYLQKSLIIVSNTYIRYLLNLIFLFQKPVAPVYIYTSNDKEVNYNLLLKNIENNELQEFTIVNP